LILVSERQLSRAPLEAAQHIELGTERVVHSLPVNPKLAPKQFDDVATVMGTSLSALLPAKFANTLSYGPIRFADIDDGLAWEPPRAFILKVDFGNSLKGEFALQASMGLPTRAIT